MACALAMSARVLCWDLGSYVEIGEAEEDDQRAPIESDLHQRIVSRRGRNDRVDAAGLADPLTVEAREISGLRLCFPHGDGQPDQRAAGRGRARRIGG